MTFTLLTDFKFSLTCISTGGPTTTVTWTRNSVAVNNMEVADYDSYLVNGVTAEYYHTLYMNGRLEGLYTCNVTNEHVSSESSTELYVRGKN